MNILEWFAKNEILFNRFLIENEDIGVIIIGLIAVIVTFSMFLLPEII